MNKIRHSLAWFCCKQSWGFLLLIIALWLVELYDFTAYIFNTIPTPFNWQEALFETIITIIIAILYITLLYRTIKSSRDSLLLYEESEDKYKQVVERATDGIILIQNEKIIYINKSVTELSGFSSDKIIGRSFLEFVSEQDKERLYQKYKERMQGKKQPPYEAILKNKEHGIFFAEISGGRITLNNKPANLVIIRDITAKKKEQIQLQKEREYYFSFVESLHDWVWEINKHGTHTFSNSAVKDILGYSKEEIIGMNMTDLWPRDPSPAEKVKLQNILSSGNGWSNQQTYFRHKNGTIKIVGSSAIPIYNEKNLLVGYRGVDRDITEKAHSEQRITQINQVFQNFKTDPDANIEFITAKTNQILNGSFSIYKKKTSPKKLEIAAATNLPPTWGKNETLITDICDQVIVPDKLEAIAIPNLDSLDIDDKNIKAYQVKSLLAFPIRLHEKIIGALCLYCTEHRDFSNDDLQTISTFGKAVSLEEERKNIISKLQKANQELTELKFNLQDKVENSISEIRQKEELLLAQSRRAAMGEMIGNIAHQWRQPLSAVAAIIQDLEDAYDYNELNKDYLANSIEKSMEQLEYMSRTIDDFRNFFQPNDNKKEFNLKEVIEKTVKFLQRSFYHNNIELKLDLEDQCNYIGFPNQFSQVILNILNNAKDALIENRKRDRKLHISCSEKNDEIQVEIANNGGRIAPEILDKIFDPYFTTKEQGKGTGVGLYMSQVIIQKHMDGSLRAENTKEGVKFIIVLKKSH